MYGRKRLPMFIVPMNSHVPVLVGLYLLPPSEQVILTSPFGASYTYFPFGASYTYFPFGASYTYFPLLSKLYLLPP